MSKLNFSNKRASTNTMNFFILIILYFSLYIPFIDEYYLNEGLQSLAMVGGLLLSTIYFVFVYIKQNSSSFKLDLPLLIPHDKRGKGLLVSWCLFSIAVILSSFFNKDFSLRGFGLLLYIPIMYFMIIPNVLNSANEVIIKASFYSSFLHIFSSLIFSRDALSTGYNGIYENSNNLGLIAMVAIISSSILLSFDKKNSYIIKIIYMIGLLLSLFSLFISSSRTSFLSVVAALIILSISMIKNKKLKIHKIIVPLLLFIHVYINYLHKFLVTGIFDKFLRTTSNSDLLSGRNLIWNKVIEEATLMGHGRDYFTHEVGAGAHNGVLEFVGSSGLIAGILLLFFLLAAIKVSLTYTQKYSNSYSLVPLIIVVSFFIITMSETTIYVIGRPHLMIFYTIIGVMIYAKEPA